MVTSFRKNLAGFSLIEALLAGSLLAVVIFTLSSVMIFGQESSRIAGDRQRATSLAEEGLEAVRNMSESSFSSLTTGPHGLAISSNRWQFSGTQDNPEIFTRTISIADINSYTKSVTSTVTWAASPQRTGTISLNSRFTNWRRVGVSNWASTTIEAGYTATNTANGDSVRVDGNYAYVGLLSGTNNFLIIDISSPASPTLVGQTSVTGVITDMEVSGNYVYISSTADAAELTVVNVSNKNAPVVSDTYDIFGTNDGLSVDVLGTTVYLGCVYNITASWGEFYVFNASDPANILLIQGYDFAYSIYDIQVSSDYKAYLATNGNTAEFVVINVQAPSSASVLSSLNIVGSSTNLDALAIAIFDSDADGVEDKAIVARASEGRIWPINVSTPSSPALVTGLANGYTVTGVGAMSINDIQIFNSNNYLAIATAAATAEVVVIDITTLSTPSILSTINVVTATNAAFSFTARGLVYAAGVDRLLAVGTRITTTPFNVLKIIKPN